MPSASPDAPTIYERVKDHLFVSGRVLPGSRVVETLLADELGVSRIPIRESLRRLAGQGLLEDDQRGEGLRLRSYSPDEVRQLYELRELLEGGAARGAARSATATDLTRLDTICKQAEALVGQYGSRVWADLDHAFHVALGEASHNPRISRSLSALLTECHYVFYVSPMIPPRYRPTASLAERIMRRVLNDHRKILQFVRARDADGAERKARRDMRISSKRMTNLMLKMAYDG